MAKVFDTPKAKLVVKVPAGRIDIETIDSARTEVEVEPFGNDNASRHAAEEAKVEMHEEGGRAVVHVEVQRSTGFPFSFKNAQVRVSARVPHGTELEATSASANVSARGMLRSAWLKSASGDIDIGTVDEDLVVKSASGDLRFGAVGGDVKIQTASGDVVGGSVGGSGRIQAASGQIALREASSQLRVQTASGDQSIDSVSEGQISLQTASGDIRIGVARGSVAWIDARSMSGSTTSELDLDDAPPEGGGSRRIEIRATSISGDVEVVRAPAPPAPPRRTEVPDDNGGGGRAAAHLL